MINFPKFFMLMPAKTGSTAVYYMLDQHPQLNASVVKETAYISKLKKNDIKNTSNDLLRENYMKLWNNHDERLVYEITPEYCRVRNLRKIFKLSPHLEDTKFIFVTRDPYERFLSHYIFRRAKAEILHNDDLNNAFMKDIDEDFKKHWIETANVNKNRPDIKFYIPDEKSQNQWYRTIYKQFFVRGCYHDSIKLLYNNKKIKKENIKILQYEDLKSDHSAFMSDIFNFLNIDDNVVIENIYTNEGKLWKKYFDASLELTPNQISYIKEFYKIPNQDLYNLTGINYNE